MITQWASQNGPFNLVALMVGLLLQANLVQRRFDRFLGRKLIRSPASAVGQLASVSVWRTVNCETLHSLLYEWSCFVGTALLQSSGFRSHGWCFTFFFSFFFFLRSDSESESAQALPIVSSPQSFFGHAAHTNCPEQHRMRHYVDSRSS